MEYELEALWVNIAVAVGTLAAAIVPLVLFFSERKDRVAAEEALGKERRERLDEERQRSREALEAEVRKVLVSSEIHKGLRGPDGAPGTFEVGSVAYAELYVKAVNRSPNVIFDVVGHAGEPDGSKAIAGRLFSAGTPIVPHGRFTSGRLEATQVDDGTGTGKVLQGKREYAMSEVDGVALKLPAGWQDEVRPRRVWVEFTDVARRRWARYEDGAVERLDADKG